MTKSAVEAWITERHLAPGAADEARTRFAAHPAKVAVLQDFLPSQTAERLTLFLEQEAQFAPEYGLYSADGGVPQPEWEAAAESDRFFRLSRLAGIPPQFQLSPNALTYLRMRQAFQRDEMRCFFESVSGLALGASDDFGVHAMHPGDFLRPHSDDNRNRRLALVLYLSRDWSPAHGGQLVVHAQDGSSSQVVPRWNSLVMFDVLAGSTHEVLPVSVLATGAPRLTIGGWYHRP